MQRAFISLSYSHRHDLASEIQAVLDGLSAYHIAPTVFVNEFTFDETQSREMMQTALQLIRECDVLIAEVTYKAIGVGVEIGYAVAHHKPVIYLRISSVEYSTTVGGVADIDIVYTTPDDLRRQLIDVLAQLTAP
jgi:nucleoside 2-deoxyribosyltransferase